MKGCGEAPSRRRRGPATPSPREIAARPGPRRGHSSPGDCPPLKPAPRRGRQAGATWTPAPGAKREEAPGKVCLPAKEHPEASPESRHGFPPGFPGPAAASDPGPDARLPGGEFGGGSGIGTATIVPLERVEFTLQVSTLWYPTTGCVLFHRRDARFRVRARERFGCERRSLSYSQKALRPVKPRVELRAGSWMALSPACTAFLSRRWALQWLSAHFLPPPFRGAFARGALLAPGEGASLRPSGWAGTLPGLWPRVKSGRKAFPERGVG